MLGTLAAHIRAPHSVRATGKLRQDTSEGELYCNECLGWKIGVGFGWGESQPKVGLKGAKPATQACRHSGIEASQATNIA